MNTLLIGINVFFLQLTHRVIHSFCGLILFTEAGLDAGRCLLHRYLAMGILPGYLPELCHAF
jgi:hypothetical protein